MHILVFPSWYRTEENPNRGVFFREQAHGLKRSGHRVGVISPRLRPVSLMAKGFTEPLHGIVREDDDGIPTYREYGWAWLFPLSLGRSLLWLRSGMRLFRRYVSEVGPPDMIHAHGALYAGELARRIKAAYGIPYILTEHSSAYARDAVRSRDVGFIRRAFEGADARVVVSPDLGALLEKSFGTVVTPWTWIPNALSSRFCVLEHDRPSHGEKDHFTFLHVGRFRKIKGQDHLLKAFAKAFKGDMNTRLFIGGEGPIKEELVALAGSLQIDDQVRFLGMLTRNQVMGAMRQADVFVLSSHYESFGMVLIEALACGTPVIATACGGPECIVHEKNGMLIPPGSVSKMAEGMARMRKHLSDYDPRQIRDDCLSRFGEKAVMERLSALYEGILNRFGQE